MKVSERISNAYRDLKNFYGNMLNSAKDTSHKRFIAVGSFFALFLFGLINQLFGLDINEIFIYAFSGLAGLQSALSLFENKNKNV